MKYEICNIYHVIVHFLPKKTLFLTQKGTVFQIYKSFGIWEDPPPHVGKNSQIISFFFNESVPYRYFLHYEICFVYDEMIVSLWRHHLFA